MMYVNVWLPEVFDNSFTYFVPKELESKIQFGVRVTIPFSNKITIGLVGEILNEKPDIDLTKDILDIPDEEPILYPENLKYILWVANYYMCPVGLVLRYLLPKAFSLKTDSIFYLNHNIDIAKVKLTDNEQLLVDAMDVQTSLKIKDVKAILPNLKNPTSFIYKLVSRKIVLLEKQYEEIYKYKTLKIAVLSVVFLENKEEFLTKLHKKAPKQYEILQFLLNQESYTATFPEMFKQHGFSKSSFKALENKLFVYKQEKKIERGAEFSLLKRDFNNSYYSKEKEINTELINFTDRNYFNETDFYSKLVVFKKFIDQTLQQEKDVLFLIPDMLLFPAYYSFFKLFYKNQVEVYNNRLSDFQRVEKWKNCYTTSKRIPSIFLTTKEGVFLPFNNLGGIIVDNEQDILYKQNEISPMFNARDMAFALQQKTNSKILLSSIVPSLELFLMLKNKELSTLVLDNNKQQNNKFEVKVIDVQKERENRNMVQHFSKELIQEIDSALVANKQILVFKDKRGYASKMECKSCTYIPRCINCSVDLTFHKSDNQLRCHKCGFQKRPSYYCASCSKPEMEIKGYGTEKIYEELKSIFDKAKIVRLDRDTIQGKKKLNNFIDQYDNGEIDILIGTRLLAKGLDLSNTAIFAVVLMDDLLNYPDFRVEERALQNIFQIAESVYSQNNNAKIILQTYQPKHSVIKNIVEGNRKSLLPTLLEDRKKYLFPPYTRLVSVLFKHKNKVLLDDACQYFYEVLSQKIPQNIIQGPYYPSLERLRGMYQKQIVFNFPKNKDLASRKRTIKRLELRFKKHAQFKSVQLKIDVDPQYL